MTTFEEAEEDYLRHNSKTNLRLLPGGKMNPPDPDWLSKLPVGSRILVNFQEGFGSTFLMHFQISDKSKHAVQIWDLEKDNYKWVIPTLFCAEFRLFEILHLEEKETDD